MAHVHPAPGSLPLLVSLKALCSILSFASYWFPTQGWGAYQTTPWSMWWPLNRWRTLIIWIDLDVIWRKLKPREYRTRKNCPLLCWSWENNTRNKDQRLEVFKFWTSLEQFPLFLLQHEHIYQLPVNGSRFPSKTSKIDGNLLRFRILGNLTECQILHDTCVRLGLLTLDFDVQKLWGVVWCGHIFVTGHTTIGTIIYAACMRDGHHQAVWSLLDCCAVPTAPKSLIERMPSFHVLKRKNRIHEEKNNKKKQPHE